MFESQTSVSWGGSVLWLIGIAVASFLVSWVLTDRIGLRRGVYVGALPFVTGAFTAGWMAWSGAGTAFWTNHRIWGLVGAVVTGAFLSFGVSRAPATASQDRRMGAGEFLWDGVVYGAAEGLLLSVLPVAVTWQAFASSGWTVGWRGILAGLASLAASAVVIVVHHLGYPEFRSSRIGFPVMGCSVLSVGYLFTGSPIAAMGGHFILHVAMMLRGVELPPQAVVEPEPRAHPTEDRGLRAA